MKLKFGLPILIGFAVLISFALTGMKPDKKGKKSGHEIKVRINHINDSVCYLYHHYGDKQKAVDTVPIQKDGSYVFKGDDELPGGIYIVYIPDKVYFEIIVNEQNFSIETDTGDFISNMKIQNSVENKIFNDYQKYRKTQFAISKDLKDRMEKNKQNKDSVEILKAEQQKIFDDMEKYNNDLMAAHPETFFLRVLNATKPIEVPAPPKDKDGNILDSSFQLRYHQRHYFDNIDFSDDRMLRTPIFQQKIDDYLKLLTHPAPDSVIKSIDFILGKAKANDEMFRYCLATLYNKYNSSKIMGYDAVFVHISEKYYISGEAYWADSAFVADITKRVRELTPTLIGEKAINITLIDTLGMRIPLYSVNAKYTILFFYEPDCGHCKKATPKLKDLWLEMNQYGVEVYAVCIKTDIDEWKEFINKFELDWINVSDPYRQSNFRNFYDVRSTPVIYVLDEEKTIIAKRLSPEQVFDMLSDKLGLNLPKKAVDPEEKH